MNTVIIDKCHDFVILHAYLIFNEYKLQFILQFQHKQKNGPYKTHNGMQHRRCTSKSAKNTENSVIITV